MGAPKLPALAAQLSRYWLVSVLAMALDWTIFLTLIGHAMPPAAAGIVGYATGLGLHYLLSVRFVFDAAATQKGCARLFGEFVLSGFVGVAVTGSLIALATSALGLGAIAAKLCATSASFVVVYSLRRGVVFAACNRTGLRMRRPYAAWPLPRIAEAWGQVRGANIGR
jgi:putative flippase GtrA